MRRTEREMTDRAWMDQVLEDAGELAIALNTGEAPYVLAVNHVLLDDCLYFHCAREGRKLDLIRLDARVGFMAAVDIRVEGTTTRYRSVCGTAVAELVDNDACRDRVLKAIARKFKAPCRFPISEQKLAITAVVRLRIGQISGKYSRSEEGPRPMAHYQY